MPRGPVLSPQQIKQRKEDVVEAAIRVNGKNKGSFTTKAIAHEMGTSETVIFRYYSSKEEILQVCLSSLEQVLESLILQSRHMKHASKESFAESLLDLWNFFKIHTGYFYIFQGTSFVGCKPSLTRKHKELRKTFGKFLKLSLGTIPKSKQYNLSDKFMADFINHWFCGIIESFLTKIEITAFEEVFYAEWEQVASLFFAEDV